ncbi:hypothetical protein NDU88_006198 [Pleurodeles waltl]|uniref:CCHC-type domain-containing protein n=1 Tax=Pleurodeles waltl TaxID=8319 RepID=A0AAV7UKA7_PLEWA|nr:hypothetical protein NDU88_006198 [Pleurodeles waltl]
MNDRGEDNLSTVQAPQLREEVLKVSTDSKTPVTIQEKKKEPRLQRCYRYGNSGHTANSPNCYARNSQCRKCGKKGHYARVCNSDKCDIDSVTVNVNKMILCIEPDVNHIGDNVGINHIGDNVGMVDVGPVVMPECTIKLDGKAGTVLADSGSPYTMVGDKNWRAIFGEDFHSLTESDINPVSYGGANIEVIGYTIMRIQFQGKATVRNVYEAK